MKFDKTFKFALTPEIKSYIRECFEAIQMGRAYYGRIIIKDRLIGFTTNNDPVRQYTNRGESFYMIDTGSGPVHVQRCIPQMSVIF